MIEIKELYSETDVNDNVFNNIFGFYSEGHVDKQEFIETILDNYDDFSEASGCPDSLITELTEKGYKFILANDVKHKYCKWFKDDESEPDSPYLLLESDTPRKDFTPMTILYLD